MVTGGKAQDRIWVSHLYMKDECIMSCIKQEIIGDMGIIAVFMFYQDKGVYVRDVCQCFTLAAVALSSDNESRKANMIEWDILSAADVSWSLIVCVCESPWTSPSALYWCSKAETSVLSWLCVWMQLCFIHFKTWSWKKITAAYSL